MHVIFLSCLRPSRKGRVPYLARNEYDGADPYLLRDTQSLIAYRQASLPAQVKHEKLVRLVI
jgi:hypothetical protein